MLCVKRTFVREHSRSISGTYFHTKLFCVVLSVQFLIYEHTLLRPSIEEIPTYILCDSINHAFNCLFFVISTGGSSDRYAIGWTASHQWLHTSKRHSLYFRSYRWFVWVRFFSKHIRLFYGEISWVHDVDTLFRLILENILSNICMPFVNM